MKNKFKKNALITFIVQVLIAISNFFILVYISKLYGADSYGDFYLIKRLSDLFWVCLLFGLTVSIPRNIHKVSEAVVVYASICVLLISLALLVLDPFSLVDIFVIENKYKITFKILVASQVVFGLSNAIQRGMESFWKYNIFMFINFICVPMICLFYSSNVESYITNLAYSSLIINTILGFHLFINLLITNKNENINKNDIYFVIIYGFKRLPGLFLASFIFTLPIYVINYFDLAQFKGNVSQMFQLFSLVLLPINTLGILLLPKISKSIFNFDKNNYINIYKSIIKICIILFLISMFFSLLVKPALLIINNNFKYNISITIISLGIFPLAIYNLFRNFVDALSNRAWTTYIILTSFSISIMVLLILLKTDIETELIISIFIFILYSLLGSLTFFTFKILNRRFIND